MRSVLAVSINPALDVTYRVDLLRRGESHRVAACSVAAGGKAVNVARTLGAMGHPVSITGFAGGCDGAILRQLLRDEHPEVEDLFVEIDGSTRRTLVVVDAESDVTGFWEQGPQVSVAEWDQLLQRVSDLAQAHAVTVVSGSLPRGVPDDAYRHIVARARDAGSIVVLDAEGAALWHALAAAPNVVKATDREIAAALLFAGLTMPSLEDAVRTLAAAGAGVVIATRGVQGVVALTPSGMVVASPPNVVDHGNPTGAGDAVAAALARGLAEGFTWPDMLDDALALAAAAVMSERAGEFSDDHYRSLRGKTRVEVVQ